MSRNTELHLSTLSPLLRAAEQGHYAVGSFSPRYTAMIPPVLRAAQRMNSPIIVQISQNEFGWYQLSAQDFADAMWRFLEENEITVPLVLHLDHTRSFEVIQQAITAGFSSVMIDASARKFAENIELTRQVVEYAHRRGVSVEAELGRIGSADRIESDNDEVMYTVPEEAQIFVEKTGVDALAVSVGTAHGVYTVRQPTIDLPRIQAIRRLTPVHLVLHGGSGVPAAMIHEAIGLPGGGVSKVNIATDLELAALAALGRDKRLLDIEMRALPPQQLELAQAAVEATVIEKIRDFVKSADKANIPSA